MIRPNYDICKTLYVISDLGSIRSIRSMNDYRIVVNENIIIRINLTSNLYEVHIWEKDKCIWVAKEIDFRTTEEAIMYGLTLI